MPNTKQLTVPGSGQFDGWIIHNRIAGSVPSTSVEDAIYQRIVELKFGTSYDTGKQTMLASLKTFFTSSVGCRRAWCKVIWILRRIQSSIRTCSHVGLFGSTCPNHLPACSIRFVWHFAADSNVYSGANGEHDHTCHGYFSKDKSGSELSSAPNQRRVSGCHLSIVLLYHGFCAPEAAGAEQNRHSERELGTFEVHRHVHGLLRLPHPERQVHTTQQWPYSILIGLLQILVY